MNVLVASFYTSETLRIPASVQLLLLTFIILLSIRNSGLLKICSSKRSEMDLTFAFIKLNQSLNQHKSKFLLSL